MKTSKLHIVFLFSLVASALILGACQSKNTPPTQDNAKIRIHIVWHPAPGVTEENWVFSDDEKTWYDATRTLDGTILSSEISIFDPTTSCEGVKDIVGWAVNAQLKKAWVNESIAKVEKNKGFEVIKCPSP